MILLHRLSTAREPFHLNPDLIQSLEESPDCHITLTTGASIAVAETADEVIARAREWRTGIAAEALRRSRPVR
ncbi:flagellar FlbD family protein [Conexibacter sp. SYSU D00693]|uniref:flagellar FlbD family protein n=1 Tax=Conexibacter sp. SYSU D00693 TaxID=2812560 RepID=UPI00196A91AE|nr:flagellar FlbD family protein [Conexibacter sp. SYSU D00693]